MNPFLGAGGSVEALRESAQELGGVQEVSLGGAAVIAVSRGPENGVVILLQRSQGTYEVQRMTGEGVSEVAGSWSVNTGDAAVTPIAVQEDRSGKVWLLSAGGRIGSLQGDGKPLWGSVPLEGIQTAMVASQVAFALDGAGRMWLTDGRTVFVGNGIGFQRIDLGAQLSSIDRQTLGIAANGDVPADRGAPRRLQMLADGRVAVLTPRFMASFPLNLQGLAAIMIAPGDVVAVEPNGALWSVVRDGSGTITKWVRMTEGGSQEFSESVVLPKQAGNAPLLAAIDGESLYALDYTPNATILWSTRSGKWVANVLTPNGTQPQDRAERIVVDRDGNIWALLAQRGLLLMHP